MSSLNTGCKLIYSDGPASSISRRSLACCSFLKSLEAVYSDCHIHCRTWCFATAAARLLMGWQHIEHKHQLTCDRFSFELRFLWTGAYPTILLHPCAAAARISLPNTVLKRKDSMPTSRLKLGSLRSSCAVPGPFSTVHSRQDPETHFAEAYTCDSYGPQAAENS